MQNNAKFDQAIVLSAFDYDTTGHLIWRSKSLSSLENETVGARFAGTRHSNGDVYITLNGRKVVAKRLIWIWHYGDLPRNYVLDHLDGDKRNTRIENLAPKVFRYIPGFTVTCESQSAPIGIDEARAIVLHRHWLMSQYFEGAQIDLRDVFGKHVPSDSALANLKSAYFDYERNTKPVKS
jgi:hypothetical protein